MQKAGITRMPDLRSMSGSEFDADDADDQQHHEYPGNRADLILE